ncbi:hypothetical protein [uncultured Roseobacter sp.]|nr:hypothetical protein [uncultured Roseobacter sp.]
MKRRWDLRAELGCELGVVTGDRHSFEHSLMNLPDLSLREA